MATVTAGLLPHRAVTAVLAMTRSFCLQDETRSVAQISNLEKNQLSHRAKAFHGLREELKGMGYIQSILISVFLVYGVVACQTATPSLDGSGPSERIQPLLRHAAAARGLALVQPLESYELTPSAVRPILEQQVVNRF